MAQTVLIKFALLIGLNAKDLNNVLKENGVKKKMDKSKETVLINFQLVEIVLQALNVLTMQDVIIKLV